MQGEKQLLQLLLHGTTEQRIESAKQLAEMQSLLAVFPIVEAFETSSGPTKQEFNNTMTKYRARIYQTVKRFYNWIVLPLQDPEAQVPTKDSIYRSLSEVYHHGDNFFIKNSRENRDESSERSFSQVLLGGALFCSIKEIQIQALVALERYGARYCARELFDLLGTDDKDIEKRVGMTLFAMSPPDEQFLDFCKETFMGGNKKNIKIWAALIYLKSAPAIHEALSILYDALAHHSLSVRSKAVDFLSGRVNTHRNITTSFRWIIDFQKVRDALDKFVENESNISNTRGREAKKQAAEYYKEIVEGNFRKNPTTGVLSDGKPKPPKGKGNIHRARRVGSGY